jgi:hypothetical protein
MKIYIFPVLVFNIMKQLSKYSELLLMVIVLGLISLTLSANGVQGASVESIKNKDAGTTTCKDKTTEKIAAYGINATTDSKGNLTGEWFLTGDQSDGADMKVEGGTVTSDSFSLNSAVEDWSMATCNDTHGTKGTISGACGDNVSVKYESDVGTKYEGTANVKCKA